MVHYIRVYYVSSLSNYITNRMGREGRRGRLVNPRDGIDGEIITVSYKPMLKANTVVMVVGDMIKQDDV